MTEARKPVSLRVALGVVVAIVAVYVYFGPEARPSDEGEVVWTDSEIAMIATLSPLPELRANSSNRVADESSAAEMGRRLFFDTRLSKDQTISCSSCHDPSRYFTDGRRTAVGLQPVDRHSPTIIGSQWSRFFFWDGRKDSLWSQALAPLEAEAEMGTTRVAVLHVVFDHYRAEYEELFGPMPPLDDKQRFPQDARPVPQEPDHPHALAWQSMQEKDREEVNRSFVNVGKCIEAYERKLLPREAPFDRYVAALLAGDPKGGGHLSPSAVRGLRSFIGRAGCIGCHNGPLLMDGDFHNTGLPPSDPDGAKDRARAQGAWQVLADPFRSDGRYGDDQSRPNPDLIYLDPGFEDLLGAYKTPPLRNIAETAPYGHAGQFATLDDVVEHYRRLPIANFLGHRDLMLLPLDSSISTPNLVTFLQSLTGPLPPERWMNGL
ncbi:MAG: cytochrome c peroxidase [Planctomycetota bacterium]|nr:cytochrome c peroxidase [Planctomycetota bacterium]